jgi:PAS domain S-box-containing protein
LTELILTYCEKAERLKRLLDAAASLQTEADWRNASGPGDLLENAGAMQPVCILLDTVSGQAEALDLCRRLLGDAAPAECAVVLLTDAAPAAALLDAAAEAGADEVLTLKKTGNHHLVLRLRQLLRLQRRHREFRNANRGLAQLAEERSRQLYDIEERYRFLFNTSPDAILAFELTEEISSGGFLEVNDSACHLLGYERDELLEQTIKELFPADMFSNVEGRIESILQHQQVYFETMLLRRDEKPLPVSMNVRLFPGAKRRIIIAVVHPLSMPGDGEDSYEERYRTLAIQTGQMIYDCNIRTGRIKWGGAQTRVTGFSLEEMQTLRWESWKDKVHPEDKARIKPDFRNALESVGTYQLEYRLRHKSGEYRHIEDVGVVLPDEAGKAYRLVGTVKDITARVYAEEERRRLEQERQHAQRLESLGVLAGGIAHDFNNILAAIIGLTDMAVQDTDPDSPTNADLKEALQAAHRARELVRQILMFSRQTGGERAPLFLHVVVREALKLLRASLRPGIVIIDKVDVHSGAILANAAQAHQVIMNYCTNAAQAMQDEEGTLEVEVVDEEVGRHLAMTHSKLHPGPYVRMTVRDTGHGMEKRVLERIFDPFFTTKGPGEGTGMGLAVVHGIVMSHGGAIKVETRPGRGSIFHTWFPRIEKDVAETSPENETMPRGTERVLFVDDEEPMIRFADSFLKRLGYEITLCQDGTEAMTVFEEDPDAFDLMITDQVMPGMSGTELARRIHAQREKMPIILFTGFSDDITLRKKEESGIVAVIRKPAVPIELSRAIRKALGEK